MKWIWMVFVLLKLSTCEIHHCCEGENVISRRKCTEGPPKPKLQCPNKFLVTSQQATLNTADERLRINDVDDLITNERYCVANNSQAFLVCFDSEDVQYPRIYMAVFGFMSVICIILTISVYIALPKLLDMQGICILHSITGLAIAFLVMGIGQFNNSTSKESCYASSYILYISFLYAFFWLSTFSFDIWKSLIQYAIFQKSLPWKLFYYLYSCGGPLLLLMMLIISENTDVYVHVRPQLGQGVCWFGTLKAQFVYFYVPISILLVLNIIFYIWTIVVLWKEVHKFDGKKKKIVKYRLSMCIKMFVVMGISWIFEVISAALSGDHPSVFWNITDSINSLQGVFLFLILVVFRKRVIVLINETSLGSRLPTTWKKIKDEECESQENEGYTMDSVPVVKNEV